MHQKLVACFTAHISRAIVMPYYFGPMFNLNLTKILLNYQLKLKFIIRSKKNVDVNFYCKIKTEAETETETETEIFCIFHE
ncbi:hypothetical protein BpHYR1_014161 [Brachionus plicatilis]|uniref:Uncharacterized protein n=1 Tax=Brachionus plicatilis TaxID=10195 RepID=A0A3M7RDK5_BRAPC|nr:hypothetical protein BpHYR1_014161 [Brachionus plicatilis]